MLRIFMSRRLIESVNRGRRVSADGVPEADLVAELEAEEEEELAQMDASLAEPDRTWVVGPDGVVYILERPVVQTVKANAHMIFAVEPTIHARQSIAAAKVNLRAFLRRHSSCRWIPNLGDAITQQYDLTAAHQEADLRDRVLPIVGGLHYFKMAGGMVASHLLDMGRLPLFASIGYHTNRMAAFVISGGRIRKLAVLLMDAREGFWSEIVKHFMCIDTDFLATCGADGACDCRAALTIFRHFRAFNTQAAKHVIRPFIAQEVGLGHTLPAGEQPDQYGAFHLHGQLALVTVRTHLIIINSSAT
jgi:hypothetical protein